MSRYQSTSGVVINKKIFKEKDLLITLLTPKLGKIITIAKGVKSIKSNRSGSLQLGNTIKTSLYQKNGYHWMSESQSTDNFLHYPKNLTQVSLLFYFLELVNSLIADSQQINGIYDIVVDTIKAISDNNVPQYILGEINFIRLLGFGLPLEITQSFNQKDYKVAQKHIQHFFESVIEKPLESPKLFR